MCLDGAMVQRSETRRHGVEILAEWAAARTNVLLVLEAEEDAEEWLGQACCLSIMHGMAAQECPYQHTVLCHVNIPSSDLAKLESPPTFLPCLTLDCSSAPSSEPHLRVSHPFMSLLP